MIGKINIKYEWSIAVYFGESPFALGKSEQSIFRVITHNDVTDIKASFAADPFMVLHNGEWHMFFEVLNEENQLGEIGHASSRNLSEWNYSKIVLREPFHLSYPSIIQTEGKWYMIPETRQSGAIRLYEAIDFPAKWEFKMELARGDYADPTIFFYKGKWWMYVLNGTQKLFLFHSDSLMGPWIPHVKNPIIPDSLKYTRPAGNPVVYNGKLYRFAQDGVPTYGNKVRAFEVDIISEGDYSEHEIPESPVLKASRKGWNSIGMHHVNAHQLGEGKWVACVDGADAKFEI